MNILLTLSFLLLPQFAAIPRATAAGGPPTYDLIRILVADAASLRPIWDAGLDFEGSTGKPGGWMEFVAGAAEMRALEERGVAYEVVTRDLAAASEKGLHPGPMDALGFGAGSMGGYYTYDEVGAQLDSMRLLYPGLVSEKLDFGYTPEGRPIWVVRISDNPDLDEPSEPEALYTSLTHAREPAGMMSVVYYMWWLLENYATDPRAEYLVNNRQMWFIPVVNADGYRYNQSTNPAGGGFWRKNRRYNGDGTWGIDLNRNYGPYEMWNSPNGGSSASPGSDTYRGPDPFSEPETQTIDSFMRLHSIRTCLNYHTYSRMLVYPYGYSGAESPDSLIFREFAFDLTRVNRYVSGTDQQTVNYSTRGNSDDYMYGDTTKFRTFAMTPEVGTSFWPPSGQILPLALENLEANIYYSFVAGAMPALRDIILPPAIDSAGFLPGSPFSFSVSIGNRGLDTARRVAVSLSAWPAGLSFEGMPVVIASLPPRSDTTITVAGTVDSGAVAGARIPLLVRITDLSGYDRTDTAHVYAGKPSVLLSDGGEEGTTLWTATGNWDAVPFPHDGSFSFHDSPSGTTLPWSATGIESATEVNLAGYSGAKLEFWTTWAIEPANDFGLVKVSRDSGATWNVERASLSNPASGSGAQAPGSYGYDGYTPGVDWVRQELDLTPYAGDRILLRFELDTDGSDSRDGWYIDDIRVTGYRAPVPGGTVSLSTTSLADAELTFGEWPGAR
jgi:carboxypeptidase T